VFKPSIVIRSLMISAGIPILLSRSSNLLYESMLDINIKYNNSNHNNNNNVCYIKHNILIYIYMYIYILLYIYVIYICDTYLCNL
jgi:hypothetical protein